MSNHLAERSLPVRHLAAALLLGTVAAAGTARAEISVFHSRAAFLAAVVQPGVDSFDDLEQGSPLTPLERAAGAWNYTLTSTFAGGNPSFFYVLDNGTDHWLSTLFDDDTLTVRGLPLPVNALGGAFFATDAGGAPVDQPLRLVVRDLAGSLELTLPGAGTDRFVGFVSSTRLVSLTVSGPVDGGAFPTLNDLTLAVPAAVPEPASALLAALGLAATLGWAARRRVPRMNA